MESVQNSPCLHEEAHVNHIVVSDDLLEKQSGPRLVQFVVEVSVDENTYFFREGSSELGEVRIPLRSVPKPYFPFGSRRFSIFDPLPHFFFEKLPTVNCPALL